MEVGMIRKVDIDTEMQQSYLDYAMSVIVSRALPDARDGLKPVQRRILYAMYDMGLRSESTYKKSARIVGEVLGKYHPHGDMAVYEAMARLAQDFSMRYMLVDGQGNFGSVDGDPPAAMRYTEARLMPFAMELLSQLDRNTIDFTSNFDDTMREPVVLPAAAPNLLVNGATGIAVGMATNIPPHNLTEIVDALLFMLGAWEHLDDINISDLMNFVKGPDFPTGGIILEENGQNDLHAAYASGRGRVLVRGRVHAEEMGRGRSRLIITEIPYMTNKSSLIERIAELVREGHLDGISDLRDESDRQGMRIVIEVSKAAQTDDVLRKLYQHTPLQTTFGIHLLALVDNEPHLLTLKQALRVYLEHRLEVVRRRSEYDLERARQRAHILEGLRIAISNLDEIITMIRNSPDVETAKMRLIKRFKLSDLQAQAILDMQLRRLAALERKKIEDEYKELQRLIKEIETLLRSPKKMRQVVGDELQKVKETYGDRRRTQIVSLKEGESGKILLTADELTPGKDVWVCVSRSGLISRTGSDQAPALTGEGAPQYLVRTNTHHTLYLVTPEGRAAGVTVESLPVTEDSSSGYPLYKAAPFSDKDTLAAVFALPPRDQMKETQFVLTCTKTGLVKKSVLLDLPGPSTQLFTLVKVNSDDALIRVTILDEGADIFLATAVGNAIRFSQQDVRPMGMVAAGVNGIKLKNSDTVVAMETVGAGDEILLIAADGKAWRLPESEFPVQGRYGQGITACKLGKGETLIGGIAGGPETAGLAQLGRGAVQFVDPASISAGKRTRAGQETIHLTTGDQVFRIEKINDAYTLGTPKEEQKPLVASLRQAASNAPVEQPQLELNFSQVTKSTKSDSKNGNGSEGKQPKAKKAVETATLKPEPSARKKPIQKIDPLPLTDFTEKPQAKTGKAVANEKSASGKGKSSKSASAAAGELLTGENLEPPSSPGKKGTPVGKEASAPVQPEKPKTTSRSAVNTTEETSTGTTPKSRGKAVKPATAQKAVSAEKPVVSSAAAKKVAKAGASSEKQGAGGAGNPVSPKTKPAPAAEKVTAAVKKTTNASAKPAIAGEKSPQKKVDGSAVKSGLSTEKPGPSRKPGKTGAVPPPDKPSPDGKKK
jgi:DNA gyrase subunit A